MTVFWLLLTYMTVLWLLLTCMSVFWLLLTYMFVLLLLLTFMLLRLTSFSPGSLFCILLRHSSASVVFGGSSGTVLKPWCFAMPESKIWKLDKTLTFTEGDKVLN